METAPRAALEMIQAELFLHLLIALFHRPTALPQPDRRQPARVRGQVREGVLDLTIAAPLDQQPDRLGEAAAAASPSPGPARRGPRRTAPTAPPWSLRATSPCDAAGDRSRTSGPPAGGYRRPGGGCSAAARPSRPRA